MENARSFGPLWRLIENLLLLFLGRGKCGAAIVLASPSQITLICCGAIGTRSGGLRSACGSAGPPEQKTIACRSTLKTPNVTRMTYVSFYTSKIVVVAQMPSATRIILVGHCNIWEINHFPRGIYISNHRGPKFTLFTRALHKQQVMEPHLQGIFGFFFHAFVRASFWASTGQRLLILSLHAQACGT